METEKEIILNGGADKINGYDDGEWKEFKKNEDTETNYQQELELMKIFKEETALYQYIKDGIY